MHPFAQAVARFAAPFLAAPRAERKAAVSTPIAGVMPMAYAQLMTVQELPPYQAWLLYKNVSTLSKVVDLIADEAARLVPLVQVDGAAVPGHPVTEFMKRPGFNRTRQRFIKELAVQYLVTGNAYPHVIGDIRPGQGPLALDVLKSQFINFTPDADMWPAEFYYSEGTRSIRFHRGPEARDFRWYDDRSGFGEIVPIFDLEGARRGIGLSKLNSVQHDVEMRLKGILHNSSLLDNGARPSGIYHVKDGLDLDQRADLEAQINAKLSGYQNAGRIILTGGAEAEYNALSQNNKDMDFMSLVKLVEDAIVSRYSVPVSLFRTEAQTNNNYEVAWRQLYFTAVLPCFEVIWSGLANMFTMRLGEPIEIVHDALTNPILAMHATERATKLFSDHIISRNEARNMVGFEPCLGGDTIYGPMGEVPVGEDFFNGIDENLTADAYHDQREGDVAPERQKPEKPAAGAAKPAAGGKKSAASAKPAAQKPVGKSIAALHVVH